MSHFSPKNLVALSVATVLAAGLWMPAQVEAAPDPNPPAGYGTQDRNRRADRDVLRGTVERVESARRFDLRARDGRTYRVNLPFSLGLQSGLKVRVSGDLRGSTFDARMIAISNDDSYDDDDYGNSNSGNGNYGNGNGGNGNYGNNNGNYQGQSVILRGQVTRIISRTDFEVRDDDDGKIYRVTTQRALDYSVRVGSRIETRGVLNGNRISSDYASENGVNNDNDYGKSVDFPATVQSLLLNIGEATVRADNGYTYRVKASRSLLDGLRVGQRVQVRGTYRDNVVQANTLSRIY